MRRPRARLALGMCGQNSKGGKTRSELDGLRDVRPRGRPLFGDVGVGKAVVIMELINNIALKHRGSKVELVYGQTGRQSR